MTPALLLAAQVVLWHSYHGAEQRALEQAVGTWNAAHPDAPVTPVAVPFGGFEQKLQAAIPRGHGPDAYIKAQDVIGDWSRTGLLAPLPEGALDERAFLDGTVAPLRQNGRLWGVPLSFKSPALYYRTDAVARAPETTDAMVTACRSLARPGHYCLAYEAGSFYHHAAWLHGHGGRIFDAAGAPRLDTPEGAAALGFVRALAAEHLLPDETSATLVTELFGDGRAAFAIGGPSFAGELPPGVPFAVAPLPRVSSTGLPAAPLLSVEAGMLSPRAQNPTGALAFLRWLAGREGAVLRARIGGQPVTDRAAWDDPAVAGDPALGAFRAQLAHTVPMSGAPSASVVWEPAQQALRRVLRGDADPALALREADRRIAIALRPPPPASAPRPYLAAASLLLVAGAAWAVRRARRAAATHPRGSSIAWAWLGPAALAMAVLVLVPFAVGAALSLFHSDGATYRFVGLANFAEILSSHDQPITDPLSFYFTLAVTALWTVANVSLHVGLGVALALLLRDPLLRLRGVYRVLLIVPWAVPNYITALIWKGMFHRQFGAVNALLAALGIAPVSWFARFWTAFTANLTTNVWLGFPFMMVTALGALSRIPKELEEAAALDGATALQRLRHLVLPLLAPAMLPAVVLGAVWTFNMFNVVFLVSGGEPDGATDILVSQAYRWAFTRGHRYGYAAAYAVLIFAVLALQSALSRRAAPTEDAA